MHPGERKRSSIHDGLKIAPKRGLPRLIEEKGQVRFLESDFGRPGGPTCIVRKELKMDC